MDIELRFNMTNCEITSPLYVSKEVLDLPDRGKLYRLVMLPGFEIILTSSRLVRLHGAYREQDVFLFDKLISTEHTSNCDIIMPLLRRENDYMLFGVNQRSCLGRVTEELGVLYIGGVVTYNGEPVNVERSRRLYMKARMLCG